MMNETCRRYVKMKIFSKLFTPHVHDVPFRLLEKLSYVFKCAVIMQQILAYTGRTADE
jgi:hypothetical protein